jgi:CubicO group peptidase (beta-lactamase class C family)
MTRIQSLLAAASALLATSPALADIQWTPEREAQARADIEAGTFGTVTSVLILQDEEVVFEGYFNGADAQTLHNTRSVTKTIIGQIAGLAISDGVLGLDQPLAPLFADIHPFQNPDPRKDAITPLDLLTMSGPLECDDWNEFSRGNEERMYLVEDWSRFFWDLPIRGYPSWATPPSETEYGRSFSYCTAGVQVLGEAVARAAGRAVMEYAEERLFAPLGVDAFEWAVTASGRPHLGGGLLLTSRGLAAFAELQRTGGIAQGQRILPESWTTQSITPQGVISEGGGFEYGYLWWLDERHTAAGPVQLAMMNGNGGNRVWIVPEHGLTIVLTKTDFNTATMHREAFEFFEQAIAPALTQ